MWKHTDNFNKPRQGIYLRIYTLEVVSIARFRKINQKTVVLMKCHEGIVKIAFTMNLFLPLASSSF